MGVVLVVALVIGTGVLHSTPPTAAQRAAAIDADIRCPSCEDLSVAESSAPTAVTVRATVRQLADAGQSDGQIRQYLVARYGSSIVLDPPASGWSLLVWVLPLAGLAVAALAVGTVLYRRRGPIRTGTDGDPGPDDGGLDPGPRSLHRTFLEQSLADADAEYLAGDLSDRDYLALRRRDMARLAALGPDPATTAPPTDVTGADHARAGTGRSLPSGGGTPVAESRRTPGGRTDRSRSRRATRRRPGATEAADVAVPGRGGGAVRRRPVAGADPVHLRPPAGPVPPPAAVDPNVSPAAPTDTRPRRPPTRTRGTPPRRPTSTSRCSRSHPDNEVALAQLGWLEFETGRAAGSAR